MATRKLPRRIYEPELLRVQGELLRMQEWVKATVARVVEIVGGSSRRWTWSR